jgi:CO dehydrogenase maturation factor
MVSLLVFMSWILAITGKGGVGKTTLAALAVRWLAEHGHGPVLAVDADPNSCLDAALGVQVHAAVGSVREETRRIVQAQAASNPATASQAGIGKQELLEMKIQQAIVETRDFDLIAMGRPEGPGCYCYANNVLAAAVRRLAGSYPSVVIDNEAGLENLSRRIVTRVDQLVFVTDPSQRGITTTRRLYDLAIEMSVDTPAMGVVINRARDDACVDRVRKMMEGTPVEVLGVLPENAELAEWDTARHSIMEFPARNAVCSAAAAIFERMSR